VDQGPGLSRFNVRELRMIEKALAQHLRLNIDQVDEDGFSVVPDSRGILRVSWRGSAPITIDDFQSIVDEATVEPTSTGRQPRAGQHAAPVPKVTRRQPRRRPGYTEKGG
jgi:hypothetical protein